MSLDLRVKAIQLCDFSLQSFEVMLCFALNQQYKWTLPLMASFSSKVLKKCPRSCFQTLSFTTFFFLQHFTTFYWYFFKNLIVLHHISLSKVVLLTPLNEGLFIINSLGAPGRGRVCFGTQAVCIWINVGLRDFEF